MAVRFVRSYGLEDNLGSLMDYIIKHPDKTFNDKVFPKYEPYQNARVLIDENKNNKLTLNSENILLEINSSSDFERDFSNFLDGYEKIILKEIFKEFNIGKVDRFGCVLKGSRTDHDDLYKEMEGVLKKHNKEPDGFAFRFNCTKKTPKEIEQIVTTDYENQIITYEKKTGKEELIYSVDYQKYYQPPLEKITDADLVFSDFCKNALKKFKEEYLKKK